MKNRSTLVNKTPKRIEMGKRLEKIINKQGFTQKEIEAKGKARGYTFNASSISLVINGGRPLNIEMMEVLVEDFNVNPRFIFGSSEEKFLNIKAEFPKEKNSLSDLDFRICVLEKSYEKILKMYKYIDIFFVYLQKNQFSENDLKKVAYKMEQLKAKGDI